MVTTAYTSILLRYIVNMQYLILWWYGVGFRHLRMSYLAWVQIYHCFSVCFRFSLNKPIVTTWKLECVLSFLKWIIDISLLESELQAVCLLCLLQEFVDCERERLLQAPQLPVSYCEKQVGNCSFRDFLSPKTVSNETRHKWIKIQRCPLTLLSQKCSSLQHSHLLCMHLKCV